VEFGFGHEYNRQVVAWSSYCAIDADVQLSYSKHVQRSHQCTCIIISVCLVDFAVLCAIVYAIVTLRRSGSSLLRKEQIAYCTILANRARSVEKK
jgi:hypothetical protein